MSLTSAQKAEIINQYKRTENDTGTPEVQIAVMTNRISYLTEHFKANHKDHHSRRGLLALVSKRRKLLVYLKREDRSRYKALIAGLGLRDSY